MKIEIELSKEAGEPIKRMADFLQTSPARIIEALVSEGVENNFFEEMSTTFTWPACGSENWLAVIEYLKEHDGESDHLKRLERYLVAHEEGANSCRTVDELKCHNSHFTSLETFEAWQAWNQSKHA